MHRTLLLQNKTSPEDSKTEWPKDKNYWLWKIETDNTILSKPFNWWGFMLFVHSDSLLKFVSSWVLIRKMVNKLSEDQCSCHRVSESKPKLQFFVQKTSMNNLHPKASRSMSFLMMNNWKRYDYSYFKLEKGIFTFEKLFTTPDYIGKLKHLGKALGPKGLMPNAKVGTLVKFE